MRKFVIAIALIAAAPLAQAGYISASVVHPTADTEGNPLSLEDITGTRYEYGTCATTGTTPTFGSSLGGRLVTGTGTTVVITGLPRGQTYCLRAFTQAGADNESAASNVIVKVAQVGQPRPPVVR